MPSVSFNFENEGNVHCSENMIFSLKDDHKEVPFLSQDASEVIFIPTNGDSYHTGSICRSRCIFQPDIFYNADFICLYDIDISSVSVTTIFFDTRNGEIQSQSYSLDLSFIEDAQWMTTAFLNVTDAFMVVTDMEGGITVCIMNVLTGELYGQASRSGLEHYKDNLFGKGEGMYMFEPTEDEHMRRDYVSSFKYVGDCDIAIAALNIEGFFMYGENGLIYAAGDDRINLFREFPLLKDVLDWEAATGIFVHRFGSSVLDISVMDDVMAHTISISAGRIDVKKSRVWGYPMCCVDNSSTVLSLVSTFVHTGSSMLFTFFNGEIRIVTPIERNKVLFFVEDITNALFFDDKFVVYDIFNRLMFFDLKSHICHIADYCSSAFDEARLEFYFGQPYLTFATGFDTDMYMNTEFAFTQLRSDWTITNATNYSDFQLCDVCMGVPLFYEYPTALLGDLPLQDEHKNIDSVGFIKESKGIRVIAKLQDNVHLFTAKDGSIERRDLQMMASTVRTNVWGDMFVRLYMDEEEFVEEMQAVLLSDGSLKTLSIPKDVIIGANWHFAGPELLHCCDSIYVLDFTEGSVVKVYKAPEGYTTVHRPYVSCNTVVFRKLLPDTNRLHYISVLYLGNCEVSVTETCVTIDSLEGFDFSVIDTSSLKGVVRL
ncbi:hypothetical protein PCE1_001513 [Barthelona sp. PCE]